MYCKHCNIQYTRNAKFCTQCGTSLEDALNCYGEAFQSGDESAFEKIYFDTEGWLCAAVRRKITGSDVEDCMQEIYVRVYEKISQYDSEKGTFRPWFNAVAKNCLIDYHRKMEGKQGRDVSRYSADDEDLFSEIISADSTVEPETVMDKKESERLIRGLLNEIPKEQSECIMLYYMNGLKQKEIADKLGIPEGTVKTRIMHGKKAIKEGVLDLEKNHGTKLYSISLATVCPWLLHSEDSQAMWETLQKKTEADIGGGGLFAYTKMSAQGPPTDELAGKQNSETLD